VVASVLLTSASGAVSRQLRTFATTTVGLQELVNAQHMKAVAFP
jgi:hypothetical protein